MTSTLPEFPLSPYFEALDSGDTTGIPAMFTEDAIYVRPSAPRPDSPQLGALEVIRGRAAIEGYFERRGVLALRHYIVAAATQGQHCFVEGVVKVPDVPGVTDMVFASHARFDDSGLISWYSGFVEVVSSDLARLFESGTAKLQEQGTG